MPLLEGRLSAPVVSQCLAGPYRESYTCASEDKASKGLGKTAGYQYITEPAYTQAVPAQKYQGYDSEYKIQTAKGIGMY